MFVVAASNILASHDHMFARSFRNYCPPAKLAGQTKPFIFTISQLFAIPTTDNLVGRNSIQPTTDDFLFNIFCRLSTCQHLYATASADLLYDSLRPSVHISQFFRLLRAFSSRDRAAMNKGRKIHNSILIM